MPEIIQPVTKSVEVTITWVIDVTLPTAHLTPEFLKEFSDSIVSVNEPDDLFRFAAEQCATHSSWVHIEGLGEYGVDFKTVIGYEDVESRMEPNP